jgi:hypothetical protein
VLAPAPYVDDDPSATILIGRPLTRRCAVRGSGKSKRTWSVATVHAAESGPKGVADDGAGCAAGVATGPRSCARAGPTTNRLSIATAPNTTVPRKNKCCIFRFSPLAEPFVRDLPGISRSESEKVHVGGGSAVIGSTPTNARAATQYHRRAA